MDKIILKTVLILGYEWYNDKNFKSLTPLEGPAPDLFQLGTELNNRKKSTLSDCSEIFFGGFLGHKRPYG